MYMNNKGRYNDNDPNADNVYYNIRINNIVPTQYDYLAQYDVVKDQPVINKSSDYYLSVIDYSLNLNNIPIFIVQVQYNPSSPSDPNYTIYVMSITIGGTQYSVNVEYVPFSNLPVPQPPSPTTSTNPRPFTTNPYYYIYSYTQFLRMLNTALSTAYVNAGSPGGSGAPYFSFEEDSGLINLVVSDAFITAGATIEFNAALISYLDAFDVNFISPQTFRFNTYRLGNICNQYGGNISIPGGSYWIYTQQYYALNEWNAIRKIIFTTNSIPVNSEYKSVNIAGTNITNSIVSLSPIIYDFTPNFNIINNSRTLTFYESAQYRLVDILTDNPIYHIQVSIFWQDNFGNIFPMYIGLNEEITIKLAFLKKSLYKKYFPEKQLLLKNKHY